MADGVRCKHCQRILKTPSRRSGKDRISCKCGSVEIDARTLGVLRIFAKAEDYIYIPEVEE